MLNLKVWTWTSASWASATFTLCILYGLVAPPELHATRVLEATLPGFRWLSPGAFLLGLAESFLFGAYASAIFVALHNLFHRRFVK